MTSFKTKDLIFGYSNGFHSSLKDILLQKKNVLAVVGENGSGKTTLLKTISSLLPSINGNLFLNDKIFSTYTKEELLSNISFVDFHPHIPPQLSVYEYLQTSFYLKTNFLFHLSSHQKDKILTISKEMKIDHLQNNLLCQLSDGQKQKVFIASAVVKSPTILLLDEPSNHLDLKQKNHLLSMLNRIKEDTIIILSSHDIDFLKEIANCSLFIKKDESVFIPSFDEKRTKQLFY